MIGFLIFSINRTPMGFNLIKEARSVLLNQFDDVSILGPVIQSYFLNFFFSSAHTKVNVQ